MAKTFHTVVFQAQEGGGNPCPITLDADGLTEQQMQQMTAAMEPFRISPRPWASMRA